MRPSRIIVGVGKKPGIRWRLGALGCVLAVALLALAWFTPWWGVHWETKTPELTGELKVSHALLKYAGKTKIRKGEQMDMSKTEASWGEIEGSENTKKLHKTTFLLITATIILAIVSVMVLCIASRLKIPIIVVVAFLVITMGLALFAPLYYASEHASALSKDVKPAESAPTVFSMLEVPGFFTSFWGTEHQEVEYEGKKVISEASWGPSYGWGLAVLAFFPVLGGSLHALREWLDFLYKNYAPMLRITVIIISTCLATTFALLYYNSISQANMVVEQGNVSWLSLSILCFVGPIGFYEYFRYKKLMKIEEKFPDLLRDLAEYWRGGLSMTAAVTTLSKGEYGALNEEVQKMATQISWGIGFEEVLKLFASRIRTSLVERSVALIDEANKAGGRISDILVTAANDAREIKWLEMERKKGSSTYLAIIYVTFFVYLGIIMVISGLFVPAITKATATPEGGAGISLAGVRISEINAPQLTFLFFCAAIIQALGNGIVGGFVSEGKISAGLRHSFIMVLTAWVAFEFVFPQIKPLLGGIL